MKPIELREADFKREVWGFKYPESIKTEFFEYWTEPNKSGSKMRFEMEKTWHTGRRIARWANNGFGKTEQKNAGMMTPVTQKKEIVTDIDQVDALLDKYRLHPTMVAFAEFGKWYDLLKRERLLRQFSADDVAGIREAYNNDNEKCRCACVQMTFDSYANTNLTFGHIMNLRNRLA